MAEQFHPVLLKSCRYGAQILTILALVLLFYLDLGLPQVVQSSDYLTCMYTGAKLFAAHRYDEVYAPYSATKFVGTPCDVAAHQFLPYMPPHMVSNYNYCPFVAWLISPLTYLPPNLSLLGFQLVSLGALIGSIFLLTDDKNQRQNLLWSCLLFLPTVFTLWVGQFGIVFGLFFMAWGYHLLINKRDFASGLAFAGVLMKPQFVVVPGLLMLVLLLRGKWKISAGFLAGAALLLVLNLLVGGTELFNRWLWMMRLSEIVFTDPSSGLPRHLLISLPGTLLNMLSLEQSHQWKPLFYACTALIGLVATFACWRMFRQPEETQSLIRYTLLLGLLIMPFIMPHLMYYDLTVLTMAWPLSLDPRLPEVLGIRPQWLVAALLLAVNVYAIVFLINAHLAVPMVLLAVFALVLGRMMFRQAPT